MGIEDKLVNDQLKTKSANSEIIQKNEKENEMEKIITVLEKNDEIFKNLDESEDIGSHKTEMLNEIYPYIDNCASIAELEKILEYITKLCDKKEFFTGNDRYDDHFFKHLKGAIERRTIDKIRELIKAGERESGLQAMVRMCNSPEKPSSQAGRITLTKNIAKKEEWEKIKDLIKVITPKETPEYIESINSPDGFMRKLDNLKANIRAGKISQKEIIDTLSETESWHNTSVIDPEKEIPNVPVENLEKYFEDRERELLSACYMAKDYDRAERVLRNMYNKKKKKARDGRLKHFENEAGRKFNSGEEPAR